MKVSIYFLPHDNEAESPEPIDNVILNHDPRKTDVAYIGDILRFFEQWPDGTIEIERTDHHDPQRRLAESRRTP